MPDDKAVKEPIEYEPGATKIGEQRCPVNATNPLACMFCSFGHLLECHHPMNCYEANCHHWQARVAEDE